jgi:hypothetical protein
VSEMESPQLRQREDGSTVLRIAQHGWRLFPVRPRAKEPLVADWPHQATNEERRLQFWLNRFPVCNWGVAIGPESGMFVLDVDGENGLRAIVDLEHRGCMLPETLMTRTGRGTHAYLKWPANGALIRNSAGKLAPGLDLRGAGGYAIVPPSVHPSGATYAFIDENAQIAAAPGWLLEKLTQVSAAAESATSLLEQPSNAIPGGMRNAALTSLAGAMRRRAASPSAIEAALLAENKERCNPPLSTTEVRAIVSSVCRYEPAARRRHAYNRRPELLALSEVEAREVDWLWNPYLPNRMLAMVSGDPGAGKTFIALAIAAAITRGRKPYTGEPCVPVPVLYLSVENSPEHVVRPRFDLLQGDPSHLHLLRGSIIDSSQQPERGSVRLSDVPLLSEALRQTRARLVIVDPIQSYLGAEVDAHRSNETRPVMDGLSRLAEDHGCCILLLRHLGKASTGKAIHRGLGSIDLTAAVRTELLAGSSPEDPELRALVQLKSNLGAFGPTLGYAIDSNGSFRWTGESQLTSEAILAPDCANADKSALDEAADFLRTELRDGPRSVQEIQAEARVAGIAGTTLKRAKGRLRVISSKRSMEGAWEWSLPEAGRE